MFINPPGNSGDSRLAEHTRYGIIGGLAGIVVNSLIFGVELLVGSLTGSIAITADAFHNLTDVISSVITIASFKFASKPADKGHPFGHGRIEYLSALLISMIIMVIGYEFLRTSAGKIMNPTPVTFRLWPLLLVLFAIPVKIFLSLFNRRLSRRIDSTTLAANAFDAMSDVFVLTVASLSLVTARFTRFPVDGYLGIVVALFIMYSGFSIAKKSLNPLLGEPPSPTLVKNIIGDLRQYRYVTGVHDLVVHNYGPGRYMASIHAEVPSDVPVMMLHESIDEAEMQLSAKYDIELVIHMDPLNNDDQEVRSAREKLLAAIKPIDAIESIHDFRVVGAGVKKNLVFDAVVKSGALRHPKDAERLRAQINASLRAVCPQYNAVVNFDTDFTGLLS